mmetsp:Transcript_13002/g.47508  ORF Transcript_13002/g.47508 Transcript_13002/m.47508 type:complete len:350 (+) Transcript_13002:200-1249(+)
MRNRARRQEPAHDGQTEIPLPTKLSTCTVYVVPMMLDNYGYILVDDETGQTAVIDPAEPRLVYKALREVVGKSEIHNILITHRHWDHSGGNRELVKNHPQARVYACKEEKVLLATEELPSDRPSTFTIGRTKVAHVVTPGHTKFHSAFLVQNGLVSDHESSTLGLDLDRVEAIFSGDTLFAAGAGNHFEGPASDLYSSLHEKEIAGCPDSSLVFCGHEYTASNLAFAIWLEKHVPKGEQGVLARLEDRQQDCALRRRDKQPTIPTTLGLERATSPWMRCHQHDNPLSVRPQLHEIQQSVGDMSYLSQYPDAVQALRTACNDGSSGGDVLNALRKLKNTNIHLRHEQLQS